MKHLLLGSVALLVTVGTAGAADMPVKMPVKAAPVVAYDWTGFYIGGYYGTSVGESRGRTDPPGNPAGTRVGQFNINQLGLTIGGTVGYNWQFAPAWLVGLEGDFGTLGVDHTVKEYNDVVIMGSKADWYGTIRGRFGYVTGPSLLYVTGGVAFVNITDTFGGNSITIPASAVTTTRTGWTVGGGVETKLSRNWTAKTEYLYIDAGSYTVGTDVFGVGVAPGSGPLVPTTFDHTYHVIKTGLNYKLDGNWEGLPFFTAAMLPSNHNWGGFYAGVNVGGGMSLVHAIDIGSAHARRRGSQGRRFRRRRPGRLQLHDHAAMVCRRRRRYRLSRHPRIGHRLVRHHGHVHGEHQLVRHGARPRRLVDRSRAAVRHGRRCLGQFPGRVRAGIGDCHRRPDDTDASGWTVGGGTEVAIDSRWSAKVESLYVDVGHFNHTNVPASRSWLQCGLQGPLHDRARRPELPVRRRRCSHDEILIASHALAIKAGPAFGRPRVRRLFMARRGPPAMSALRPLSGGEAPELDILSFSS